VTGATPRESAARFLTIQLKPSRVRVKTAPARELTVERRWKNEKLKGDILQKKAIFMIVLLLAIGGCDAPAALSPVAKGL